MKVAILGTRGIPNYYGGFEQFAEYLSLGLVEAGFDVTVYNSHTHPYQQSEWNGVKIVHCYDPENKLGTIGQFVYDFNCILDCRKRKFDIILQLGYTSSSVWYWLLPRRHSIIITNMDGMEWKRSKYSNNVKQFLKYAEVLAVKHSHHLISDSIGMQEYLKNAYEVSSTYIPYGAHVFNDPSQEVLEEYKLAAYDYNLLIARLEPENSIEVILNGVSKSTNKIPFLVIGKNETKYGEYLKEKFASFENIRFLGAIYDINKLNNLRFHSKIYFHGHTVGGTNPSLLEAMSSGALICAHKNIFNEAILDSDAYFFTNEEEVREVVSTVDKSEVSNANKVRSNLSKVGNSYLWSIIIDKYINHFKMVWMHPKLNLSESSLNLGNQHSAQ
ncbi:MAG: DUF1972 domain-containing protein [Ferruginibacter sp.]